MADKFVFSMQIFLLGFSVVMIVLFLLYGLIDLSNRLRISRPEKTQPKGPPTENNDRLTPQLAAAIAAAVNHHRTASAGTGPVRRRLSLAEVKVSRWAAAGRGALLENSSALERLRRK